LFDEFEKVYHEKERQEAILTLLDGTFQTKKLFVMTVNNKFEVNANMLNRPGRIYYHYEFDGLDAEFIREYANEQLSDDLLKYIEQLVHVAGIFWKFNFDMLKAIIEEMNRYSESPEEVMKYLNTKPEFK